jgi:hypothetical protein
MFQQQSLVMLFCVRWVQRNMYGLDQRLVPESSNADALQGAQTVRQCAGSVLTLNGAV